MKKQSISNIQIWVLYFVIVGLLSWILVLIDMTPEPQTEVVYKDKVVYKEKVVLKEPKNSVLMITIDDMVQDLNRYKHLSKRQKKQIIESLTKYTEKYNVPFFAVYTILAKESSFTPVSIAKLKKNKKGRAIGIGNVILEYHPELVEVGIIEKRGDLFDIDRAIEAVCYIYRTEMDKPILKGAKTKHDSAQRRYYGGNDKTYSDDVRKKIGDIIFRKVYK